MKLSALIFLLSIFAAFGLHAYADTKFKSGPSLEDLTHMQVMTNENSSNPNDCMCKPGVVAGETKNGTGGSTGGDNGNADTTTSAHH